MTVGKSLYPDFGSAAGPAQDAPDARGAPETADSIGQRSRAAYDKGYSAGWDDATAAAARREDSVAADLERAIQDLGFTYHEAVTQVRGEFHRFVRELCDAFLPSLAAAGLRETLRERIEALADPAGSPPVRIFVPPRLLDMFEPLAEGDPVVPIEIVAEDSLSEAQAYARIGETEWNVDFTGLLASLETALCDGENADRDSEDGAMRYG